MRLLTVTVDNSQMRESVDRYEGMDLKEKKEERRTEKGYLEKSLQRGEQTTYDLIKNDAEFRELRRTFNPIHEKLFNKAYQQYKQGDWPAATESFNKCMTMRPDDGPTKTLMNVINNHNGLAPQDWKGYRALTSK